MSLSNPADIADVGARVNGRVVDDEGVGTVDTKGGAVGACVGVA